METTIKIALCQMNSTVGDLAQNSQKILHFYHQAEKEKCDLAVFPECSLPGYPAEDLILRKSFINENVMALRKITKEIKGQTLALIGTISRKNKMAFNSAALLGGSKLLLNYSKHALPNYGVFDEKRYFTPGNSLGLFRLRGIPVGVTICEDIWDESEYKIYLNQAKKGAKLLINISASPYDSGKFNKRIALLKKRAKQTKCPFIYVNLVGGQDELVFDGRSMALDAKGNLILLAKGFNEDFQICEFKFIDSNLKNIKGNGAHVSKITKLPSETEEIYDALVLGTRDYVEKNKFSSVVLGLSGGIDSALTAAIAVDALGADRVLPITMPSRFTSQETLKDAELLAGNLGAKLLKIPIETIFKAYLDFLTPFFEGKDPDITEENLQSRIRGTLLMALSNKLRSLVLTTGNKSEVSVGYCTLYGDTAGGFAMLKDVSKTLVYRLAQHANLKAGKEIIPQSTIARAPTAELKENQKDQDSLPPYETLDTIIQYYVEEDQGFNSLLKKGFDPEILKKVIQMVDANEYKRRQTPPGIKISFKSFGKDRRMPITNRFQEY